MNLKGLATSHQNILSKLISNGVEEKEVERIYRIYTKNRVYLDNEDFYFSNGFKECNKKELFDFFEDMNFNLLNIFLKKFSNRILKPHLKQYLKNYDVVNELSDIFFYTYQGDIQEAFSKIKNNLISQDNITTKESFINSIKNITQVYNFNYEYIKKEIEKESLKFKKDFIFEETEKDNVFVFYGNNFSKDLIKRITPAKYCINNEHFFTYCENPFFVIFDFNKETDYENSLYFCYIPDKYEDLEIQVYNRNNKLVIEKEEIESILTKGQNDKDFLYDSLFRFYSNIYTRNTWFISLLMCEEPIEYVNKKMKEYIDKGYINNNETFRKELKIKVSSMIKDYFYNLEHSDDISDDVLNNMLKLSHNFKDFNFHKIQANEIANVLLNKLELLYLNRKDHEFIEVLDKLILITKRWMENKSISLEIKRILKSIRIDSMYFFYFNSYKDLKLHKYVEESNRHIFNNIVVEQFKNHMDVIEIQESLRFIKKHILGSDEYQAFLLEICPKLKGRDVIFIQSELLPENRNKLFNSSVNKPIINRFLENFGKDLNIEKTENDLFNEMLDSINLDEDQEDDCLDLEIGLDSDENNQEDKDS